MLGTFGSPEGRAQLVTHEGQCLFSRPGMTSLEPSRGEMFSINRLRCLVVLMEDPSTAIAPVNQ